MNDSSKVSRLGEILLKKKEITLVQLNDALQYQSTSKKKLGTIIIEKGYTTEAKIMSALSYQTGIAILNLDNYSINIDAPVVISEKLARRTNSIPLKIWNDKILVAMSDPLNIFDIEDIEMESGRKVEVVFALRTQILEAIEKYMGGRSAQKAMDDFNKENVVDSEWNAINEKTDIYVNNSPVVRLINSLIKQALNMGSSDIHIEPYENRIRVRFRIDGDLHEIISPSKQSHSAIVTRVKVMSGMNIAEKRLPQDGRIEIRIDDSVIDMRISVIPSVYGEKVVMRILDRGNFLKSKNELGFTNQNLTLFNSILKAPNGVILVTGPTGSGKTTTLYAYLNELNKINKNIITLEDPVEYKIDGINQVQVNTKAGLNFANGLRSVLRQDPDIIMIGEIRDQETAEIAIRAAITGHLVISTIHTNDAPSTVIRLQDMGIKPFLIATSLRGVIAQRLVKKICTNCKTSYSANSYEKEVLEAKGNLTLYKGAGCPKCYNTGYHGRIAIHEIMKVDKNVRDAIYNVKTIDELTNATEKNGMKTLKDNCRELVLQGITTMDEYFQAVYKFE